MKLSCQFFDLDVKLLVLLRLWVVLRHFMVWLLMLIEDPLEGVIRLLSHRIVFFRALIEICLEQEVKLVVLDNHIVLFSGHFPDHGWFLLPPRIEILKELLTFVHQITETLSGLYPRRYLCSSFSLHNL